MREKLTYAFYRGLFGAIALLPSRALYVVADGLQLLLAKGIKYRRKVIRANLERCFPELTPEQRLEIEKDFYSQFADNFVETIKLLNISDKEVDERVKVRDAHLVDDAVRAGSPVVLYLGHYANWEFVPAIVRHFKEPAIMAQVYKPQHDKAFDRLMLKVRSRFNQVSLPQKKVFRTLVGWKRDGKASVTGFVADHRSNNSASHHHTLFLGQPTPFNPGGEEIGNRIGATYLYIDIEKPSRGHYVLTFKPIEPAAMEADSPYTRRYLEMLEQTIRRRPGLWLWSHRRWLYE